MVPLVYIFCHFISAPHPLSPSLFRTKMMNTEFSRSKSLLSQVDSSYVDDFSADNRLKEELPFTRFFCHKIALLAEGPPLQIQPGIFFKKLFGSNCAENLVYFKLDLNTNCINNLSLALVEKTAIKMQLHQGEKGLLQLLLKADTYFI